MRRVHGDADFDGFEQRDVERIGEEVIQEKILEIFGELAGNNDRKNSVNEESISQSMGTLLKKSYEEKQPKDVKKQIFGKKEQKSAEESIDLGKSIGGTQASHRNLGASQELGAQGSGFQNPFSLTADQQARLAQMNQYPQNNQPIILPIQIASQPTQTQPQGLSALEIKNLV